MVCKLLSTIDVLRVSPPLPVVAFSLPGHVQASLPIRCPFLAALEPCKYVSAPYVLIERFRTLT